MKLPVCTPSAAAAACCMEVAVMHQLRNVVAHRPIGSRVVDGQGAGVREALRLVAQVRVEAKDVDELRQPYAANLALWGGRCRASRV